MGNAEKLSIAYGLRLKEERESRGYSVFHVAKALQLKSDTIKNMESGKGLIKNFIKYGLWLGMFFCFIPTAKQNNK